MTSSSDLAIAANEILARAGCGIMPESALSTTAEAAMKFDELVLGAEISGVSCQIRTGWSVRSKPDTEGAAVGCLFSIGVGCVGCVGSTDVGCVGSTDVDCLDVGCVTG